MSFLNNTKSIRSRVLAAIETKIEQIEALYQSDLQALEDKFEADKANLAESHIDSILSKIL